MTVFITTTATFDKRDLHRIKNQLGLLDIIPLKRAPSCGESGPPYNTWFPGSIRVYTSPKASRSVQPFSQGSRSLQTDRQTDGPR